MTMKQFKVFYSWQSDLPGSTNRNFIEKCINEAVNNCNSVIDGIEIVADRDTKGITGSPNISQTIFSKIDSCDLFIADVSIVNAYSILEATDKNIDLVSKTNESQEADQNTQKVRYTPNPNVLIELGYAVKCLGWERVICFINTDCGNISKLPFDLEHQRVTPYSLANEEKGRVKKKLRAIVCDTILELSKMGPVKKKGNAYHKIGSYNQETHAIDSELVPYDVRNLKWIDTWFSGKKKYAVDLIECIKSCKVSLKTETKEIVTKENDPYGFYSRPEICKAIEKMQIASLSKFNCMIPYSISESDQDLIIELSNKYLDVKQDTFNEEFFNLGNMQEPPLKIYTAFGHFAQEKEGTEEEKLKDKAIQKLKNTLIEIRNLDLYLKTYDDVLLFPLAIENISEIADEDLDIIISIDNSLENIELITPTKEFIYSEIRREAASIYQAGFPKDLLLMQEDANIKYDDNEHFNFIPSYENDYGLPLLGYKHNVTDQDYENSIQEYIATPISDNEYEFSLNELRAGEKKWLGGIIALRSMTDVNRVIMRYRIVSKKTDGTVCGELVYDKNNKCSKLVTKIPRGT